MKAISSVHLFDVHVLVHDLALLDDPAAVELDGAMAHRHVVVAARAALATALRIGTGGEKEIARKSARRGAVALRHVAMQRDRVPQRLRVHPPAQVRYGVWVTVPRGGFAILQPV